MSTATTLAQWAEENRVAPVDRNGCMIVPARVGTGAHHNLFGLKDYVVSSVCGGTAYLCPRPTTLTHDQMAALVESGMAWPDYLNDMEDNTCGNEVYHTGANRPSYVWSPMDQLYVSF